MVAIGATLRGTRSNPRIPGVLKSVRWEHDGATVGVSAGMSKKLFVGGLSWGTTDEGLHGAFSRFGEIAEAKVITDRETGRSRGFGFVTFANDENAASCHQRNEWHGAGWPHHQSQRSRRQGLSHRRWWRTRTWRPPRRWRPQGWRFPRRRWSRRLRPRLIDRWFPLFLFPRSVRGVADTSREYFAVFSSGPRFARPCCCGIMGCLLFLLAYTNPKRQRGPDKELPSLALRVSIAPHTVPWPRPGKIDRLRMPHKTRFGRAGIRPIPGYVRHP